MKLLSIFTVALLLVGCGGNQATIPYSVALAEQTESVPEDELLDVGVVLFDPGVPDGEIEPEVLGRLLQDGTFPHIRRTEAHYMAVHLRNTLQTSGHWGSVWIMPGESTAADINVSARILHSDGSRFRLRVHAVDSTGRTWIGREYAMQTAPDSYNRQLYPGLDPYQDVFHRIANDLAAVKDTFSPSEKRNVRTVAQLRFAGELSPEAFGEHVGNWTSTASPQVVARRWAPPVRWRICNSVRSIRPRAAIRPCSASGPWSRRLWACFNQSMALAGSHSICPCKADVR